MLLRIRTVPFSIIHYQNVTSISVLCNVHDENDDKVSISDFFTRGRRNSKFLTEFEAKHIILFE